MQTITIIIETPKGSKEKFNYDPEKKWFILKKILPMGMLFPFDFGFIPNTKAEDGDPLDVVVMSEINSFTGCVMDCRIVGCITAEQTEQGKTFRNDRLIAIPQASQMFATVNELDDLPQKTLDDLVIFFITYNDLQGKKFRLLQKLNAAEALKLVNQHKYEYD
jgi:inorganic pyrophosphatase